MVFEAKYTDNASIKQDAVTDAQTEALNLHAALGAKCYVIVSFGAGNFYRIPWGVWRNMKKIYGHKYINIAEVEQYRVIMRDGIVDFLGLIQG